MVRMMKDSGVEWIGEIPENWKIQKYKNFASSKMGETILASDTVKDGIPVYSATQDEKIFGYVKTANTLLHKNDIVIPARGNSIGCATIVKDEVATCTQTTICSRNIHDISTNYLYYCCWGLKDWWFNYDGSAIPQITVKQVNNNLLPVSPIPEQQKIASFLDDKCGAIDEIITQTEQSIEEYKKLKQSVITKAVTKGIHPNRTMKDSNVYWIGVIPEGWEIKKLKYIFEIKKDIAGKEGYTVLSITQTGIKPKNITSNEGQLANDYSKYQLVNSGDFAMNHMDLLTGWVDISKYDGVTSPDYRVFRLKRIHNCDKYFLYMMQLCYLNKIFYGLGQGVSGFGRWRLPADMFLNFLIPIPPLGEQKEIASYLDEKCSDIDALIEKKQKFLTELANYKKSLIYEYVTGKKEVA